ncbi:threonine/serine exporter ThrE family protein [Pleionea sp. CnH1-48]|uniref:threonine/serine ThrE exporter family protein n=1 Tax=Pleionea sp. CnH1-48 TaxID=2954494 RepID=UPI00209760E8|nr:threonine/serine exporter family protein [Pleionea sp. CnH1-48]MCO7222821.1 threonine/serine exporter family protein [Pleionea sp. CnH1-48]
MISELFDAHSLDEQPNFPDRSLPIGFMLRLAKALHTYGMTAYELEKAMKRVGNKLGFGVQCLSQPTNIIMSFSHPQEPEPKTYVFRVDPGDIHLERQIQVSEVVSAVLSEQMSVEEGADQLKKIATTPSRYGDGLVTLSYGLVSGAIARVFNGAGAEIIVAFVIGIITGFMITKLLKSESAQFLFPTLSSMVAALLASIANHLGFLSSPYIATLAGVIILVPGLLLTTAVSELAQNNTVSGTARLFSAGTIFMQIGFGVAIGKTLGLALFPAAPEIQTIPFAAWTVWLAIAVASCGLFVLFYSRPKDLHWVILAGMIAYGSTAYSTEQFGPIFGAFVGAFIMGVAANVFERLLKVTRSVMLLPGIILLVPGSVGFHSLSLLVEHDVVAGLDTAFKMGFVSIGLVTGLLLASMFVPAKDI